MNANPKSANCKQARFLAAYRGCGTVTGAARASCVDHSSHYRWLRRDGDYAAEFAKTQAIASAELEAEARRRAVDGIEVPIYRDGKLVGHRHRYSDVLLIALLKANNPEKFGDRRTTTHHREAVSETVTLKVTLPEVVESDAQGRTVRMRPVGSHGSR